MNLDVKETLFSTENIKKILEGIGRRFERLESELARKDERIKILEGKITELYDECVELRRDVDYNYEQINEIHRGECE